MRERGRGPVPQCPFCSADLARPAEMAIGSAERGPGGTCSCGAVYLVDDTGKNVGLLMSQALAMAAEVLGKDISELVPDEDYQDAIVSYDWRTHRSSGISKGFMDGSGRMYVVKIRNK